MADQEGRRSSGDRGKRAGFDPVSGEVRGSGAGAGANANPGEDYDSGVNAGDGNDAAGGPRPKSRGIDRSIDADEGI